MTDIFVRAGSFLLIIVLGYVLKRVGFFGKDDHRLVSKIVLNVTLPATIIVNFSSTEVEPWLLLMFALGLFGNLVLLAAAMAFGKGADWSTRKLRMLNYPGYSIGCFTLPFVQNFLGASGVVATCLFDAGNSMMCTGTTYAIVAEMDSRRGSGKSVSLGKKVKEIGKRLVRSTPLLTYAVMLLLSLCHLKLPAPVLTFTGIAANANPFLSMFMIGMMFEIRLAPEKLKEMVRLFACRYGISVLVALCFYFLLPFPVQIRQALTLAAFSPLSVAALAYTDKVGSDTELASACNSCSIIVSLVVMTALVASVKF